MKPTRTDGPDHRPATEKSKRPMQTQANHTQNAEAARAISRRLKAYYDSVQEQAIPDRFLDLLEQLDNAERKASQMEKSGK